MIEHGNEAELLQEGLALERSPFAEHAHETDDAMQILQGRIEQ